MPPVKPTPSSKPKGKGLNGKIGPVPVKVAIFVTALVVGYLLYRRYKGQGSTSAGSNATPAPSTSTLTPTPDSSGGGSSGGGGDSSGGATGTTTPTYPAPISFFISPGVNGNANTSPPVTASQPSTPATSNANTFGTYPQITFAPPDATPAGIPLPASAFKAAGAVASAANPYGEYPTLNFTPGNYLPPKSSAPAPSTAGLTKIGTGVSKGAVNYQARKNVRAG